MKLDEISKAVKLFQTNNKPGPDVLSTKYHYKNDVA